MATAEIETIKELVKGSPAYTNADFRWPFKGNEAKFTSRENIDQEYDGVWDATNIGDTEDDINARTTLPATEIKTGSRVLIEYTVIPYIARKANRDDPGYSTGCTLSLLSMGLFGSRRSRSGFKVRVTTEKEKINSLALQPR